ncbi:cyclohexanone 1,2-monooxygenase [Lindgomyces ingoldianus]|uniref:Cyclohexanone 1,2-monooxygenase n=1 Tax=Lindgomyces ingoldianus TaxID=673940 RepID=A0ACB6RF26_9PLEO|nr:cyclohexanone 1,2-monooxygenase [Lindgomyces ingoldianus]KAF2477325.1 cyclohexanone 1,2-monooxygenase [Lindgomyces ingoldianus]
MSFDTEVLIIGAGMSGLGLAVQLIRQFGVRNFELIEKSDDVGGTWFANTYPGCGCDVASHFYSYSFALNPDWSRKYSMQPEIQRYFRSVAEQYQIVEHVRFRATVEKAEWDDEGKVWVVTIRDEKSKQTIVRRCKILVSAVGALSVPKKCEIPGAERFEGKMFHSAKWDHGCEWKGKDVVVLGNGCSATQFLPIMANGPSAAHHITQFSQQAQYLSERTNPTYTPFFKLIMRYVPLAMYLYRAHLYWQMERDFQGFDIEGGTSIRANLKTENEKYVKRTAPRRYWDALIPKSEIGCKRKVLDTDYLASLHNGNVELVSDDPVQEIVAQGVRTKSGRLVKADALVLAIGFATQQMLWPMEILGRRGVRLENFWDKTTQSVAQAYFGTCVPDFPNFFIMMGPNTVTGHLSVIYTVECQINFTLRLLSPILQTLPSYRSTHTTFPFSLSSLLSSLHLSAPSPQPSTVEVLMPAFLADTLWTQTSARKLVWSSGCVNWAIDPKTGLNNMMYPDWQYWYWIRSVFIRKGDFVYRDGQGKEVRSSRGSWLWVVGAAVLGFMGLKAAGMVDGEKGLGGEIRGLVGLGDVVSWPL